MSFLIVELIRYFFLLLVLNRVTGILKFFSRFKLFVHRFSLQHVNNPVEKLEKTTVDSRFDSRLSRSHLLSTNNNIIDDDSVMRDDLELLMADLGVFSRPGGEKLPEVMNFTYIFGVFEAEEPRLDEVKEAFDVFDENKDGFIDAKELQRVLCVMGLKGRVGDEDCRKMIRAFDRNADGMMDFSEFVKMMENSFC